MGIMDTMKGSMDTVRKIQVNAPMELEEVYELLKVDQNVTAIAMPELKKGLLGNSISFPKVSRVTPTVTVKGTTITIKKISDASKTSVTVGGSLSFALDKDLGKNAVHTADAGTAYFQSVAAAVETALAGR